MNKKEPKKEEPVWKKPILAVLLPKAMTLNEPILMKCSKCKMHIEVRCTNPTCENNVSKF